MLFILFILLVFRIRKQRSGVKPKVVDFMFALMSLIHLIRES